MVTKQEVAQWMYDELMRDGYLSQQRAHSFIRERFGPQFVKQESTTKSVLMEWRNLTRGKVTWDIYELEWRLNEGVEKAE